MAPKHRDKTARQSYKKSSVLKEDLQKIQEQERKISYFFKTLFVDQSI